MRASYKKWCRALSEIGVTKPRLREAGKGNCNVIQQALPNSQSNYLGEGWESQRGEERVESKRGRGQVKKGRTIERNWYRDGR